MLASIKDKGRFWMYDGSQIYNISHIGLMPWSSIVKGDKLDFRQGHMTEIKNLPSLYINNNAVTDNEANSQSDWKSAQVKIVKITNQN